MALQPDQKYQGVVGSGSALFEAKTGSIGFQLQIESEDGNTDFVIWLSEKNKERALKYFDILGVPADKLKDPNYLEFGLAQEIEGHKITFGTKEETYQGKSKVKVAWIGKASNGNVSRTAANLFGGNVPEPASGITDDDIPF